MADEADRDSIYSARRTLAKVLESLNLSPERMSKALHLFRRFFKILESWPVREGRVTRQTLKKKRIAFEAIWKVFKSVINNLSKIEFLIFFFFFEVVSNAPYLWILLAFVQRSLGLTGKNL